MNCYAVNRQLLTARADLPLAQIENSRAPPDFVSETSAGGAPTARLAGKLIHSRRDPEHEAQRLVESCTDSATVAIFYGLGLGYQVEQFLNRCAEGIAVVIEPEVALLRAALETRNLEPLLDNQRVKFLVAEDPDALALILRHHEHRPVQTVRLRSVYQRNQTYYQRLDAVQQQFNARRDINSNTLRRFAGVWIRNLSRNIPLLARTAGVSVAAERFSDTPALMLAAGPSLDLILPHITALRRRALIIAVDTAAAALAAAGVTPDLLVVVDPQWWNTRHLDRLQLNGTIVVSESSTHPRVFRLLAAPPLFAASLFPLGRYLEQSTLVSGTLGAGGSVSTSAWDLARILGCRPIYCAGLDLGFPLQRTHCSGSFFEERAHTLSARTRPAEHQAFSYLHQADPYPVSDNSNGQVLTDKRMAIYHWWFANQAKIHRDCDSRNLSPSGARIEGFPFAPLEQALALPECRLQIDSVLAEIRTAAATATAADRQPLSDRLEALISELQLIAGLCSKGLNAVQRARRNELTAKTALAQLDRIDAELRRSQNRDIAGFMVQDVLGGIVRGEDAHGQSSADPLSSSETIYAALQRSAAFHVTELQRALPATRRSETENRVDGSRKAGHTKAVPSDSAQSEHV